MKTKSVDWNGKFLREVKKEISFRISERESQKAERDRVLQEEEGCGADKLVQGHKETNIKIKIY